MRKLFTLAFAACVAFAFTSCKSSKDNVYKATYDEAREAELAEAAPQEEATLADQIDTTYRTERVVLSSGAEGALKAFNVVCGSYSRKEGAEAVRELLVNEGYNAIVVQNQSTGLYRVVCASCDTKEEAAMERDRFKNEHPHNVDFQKAWLLYNE